jgi:cytidine deaminase
MKVSAWAQLIDRALAVRQHAYAPYSRFLVGAAILAADGTVFAGVNVENASYGLTICAERSTVFSAVATGRAEFNALVVASAGAAPPCGACRQVLAEFCDDLPIVLIDPDDRKNALETSLARLLPDRFPRR